MALTIKVVPGYQFYEGEKIDTNKLNQLGRPTLDLLGSISSAIIAAGSITGDKLSPSLISKLPPKPNPLSGNDLLMIEDVSVTALKSVTITQILTAGIRDLPITPAVKYGDFVFIIQDGINKQATVGNVLREAIIGQETTLASAGAMDPAGDMLLVWDANAVAGSNPNRKALIGNVVASFTNTLIAKSVPFSGAVDRVNDEILMKDASLTAPDQQVRISLGKLLEQAGGTKAWANVHASEVVETIVAATWNDVNNVITTALAHQFRAGEALWFPTDVAGSGVDPWTPYYVRLLQGTTIEFRLFKTRAGAENDEIAQLVDLGPCPVPRNFLRWKAEPIRAGFNIASIITTGAPGTRGYFRVTFETPMASANYVVQLTGSRYKDEGENRTGPVCAINAAGADSNPSNTKDPLPETFDVICRSTNNNEATPDFLMIAVFS